MNNFNFPVGYPQIYPQQQTQPANNMIWVQGESGAKSYLLAPNTTLPLWDSERQTIYIKSTDNSGMPSMKILDYTIRENANTPLQTPLTDKGKEYATKEELNALKGEIMEKLSEVTAV
jgi:hypothetical protein